MEKRERINALDGLQAIFGVGIVIFHVNEIFHLSSHKIFAPVCEYGGYFGNYIFFIVSGFLLSHYRERLQSDSFFIYMKRRLRRLYPVYFLSNLAIILSGTAALSPQRTCATLLMISTGWFSGKDTPYNLPAWFLCVLLICDILYFLLEKSLAQKFPVRYQKARPALYLFFILGGGILERLDLNIPFLYRVCGEGYLNFFLGALLAEILGQRLTGRRTGIYVVCGLILCVCTGFTVTLGFVNLPGDMRWWISLVCASLVAIALPDGPPARILTIPGLPALGKRRLSLLLWHVPLARYWYRFMGLLPDGGLGFVLYFMVLTALSFASCSYLERPAWLNTEEEQRRR